jgi:hypothetical protein
MMPPSLAMAIADDALFAMLYFAQQEDNEDLKNHSKKNLPLASFVQSEACSVRPHSPKATELQFSRSRTDTSPSSAFLTAPMPAQTAHRHDFQGVTSDPLVQVHPNNENVPSDG